MTAQPTVSASRSVEPAPQARRRTRRWTIAIRIAVGLVLLAGLAGWLNEMHPAEREAREWLAEFRALREQATDQRLPYQPLSLAGQQVLIDRLVRPESSWARAWDNLCRRLPRSLRNRLPRLRLPRDQVIALGGVFIELPSTTELRRRLLAAALRPRASNRMYAIQFASLTWPMPLELLPLLEQLATAEEPYVRMRVALALHGIPAGHPRVEQLIAQLQADQVSVVREAARYSYRSDERGERVPAFPSHATRP